MPFKGKTLGTDSQSATDIM